MPGMPPPASDERQSLLESPVQPKRVLRGGLRPERRAGPVDPSVSTLSIGGLIKHAAGVQKGWAQRAASAPDFPPRDECPVAEIMAESRTST